MDELVSNLEQFSELSIVVITLVGTLCATLVGILFRFGFLKKEDVDRFSATQQDVLESAEDIKKALLRSQKILDDAKKEKREKV